MSELDEIKDSVHGLKVEIAGLRPVVSEIHSHMPRITLALETLARVTEKLESNKEEHQRIHYRIEEVEQNVEGLAKTARETRGRLDELLLMHVECKAECKADRKWESSGVLLSKNGWWDRTRDLIARDVVRWVAFGVLAFLLWMVVVNLPDYPPFKAALETRQGYDSGKHRRDQPDH